MEEALFFLTEGRMDDGRKEGGFRNDKPEWSGDEMQLRAKDE